MNQVVDDVSESDDAQQDQRLQQEGDEHGALAAQVIGDPAPEDAGGPIGERVQRERKREGGRTDFERVCDGSYLRGGHEAADSHHESHCKEHVKLGRAQHFEGVEVFLMAADLHFRRNGHDGRAGRILQNLSGDDDDETLSDSGVEKCGAVIVRVNQVSDEGDEERGAGAEPGGDHSGREPALIREPLQSDAQRTAINQRRAETGERVQDVERRSRSWPGPYRPIRRRTSVRPRS